MGQKVDIEFFSEDPLENVAACLKFQFDRVIFIGYEKTMTKLAKDTIKSFLESDKIGVKEVSFEPINTINSIGRDITNLYETLYQKIYEITRREQELGNECFFDLTGGEDIALVACGAVAQKLNVPMHQVSLHKGNVRYICNGEAYDGFAYHNVMMSIEDFIHIQRAKIATSLQKSHKEDLDRPDVKDEMKRLILCYKDMSRLWGKISYGFQQFDGGLEACMLARAFVETTLDKEGKQKAGAPTLIQMENAILRLELAGFLHDVDINDTHIAFTYKNARVKEVLREAGAILEIMTYYHFKRIPEINDIRVGVNLDWMVERQESEKKEALLTNEVDLIYMDSNIPTFISCKNKTVRDNETLYQLQAVTDRFGGKVANMMLVCMGVDSSIRQRCEKMGIQIITMKEL